MNHQDRQVFLATTAIEEFWDTTKPIVFLGDWCLRYSRLNVLKSLNGKVLPSTLRDKQSFVEAYLYSQDVYERLLCQMAALLNEVHNEQHSLRYWRIVLGPWLFHYIDVVYERYLSLRMAKLRYPFFDSIILSEKSFITPLSTLDHIELSRDDPYNLQIYSKILLAHKNTFRQKSFQLVEKKAVAKNEKKIFDVTKEKILKKLDLFFKMINNSESVYMAAPYFSKESILKIFLKSKTKIKPIFFPSYKEIFNITLNHDLRIFFNKISLNNNEFESILQRMLPYDIPCSFLESYKIIKQESSNYPTIPKGIISWTSWYFDEKFKVWAAAAAELGSLLYGAQHGGNYGIDKYMKAFEHELAITDKYFSWGWKNHQEHVIPMTVSMLTGKKKIKKNENKKNILFAGTAIPRYLFRLEYPNNAHLEKYLNNQINFFKNIDNVYQKFIKYRAPLHDYGSDCVKRILDVCPNLVIESWDVSFQESLVNSKIIVCDHLGTVYAEAFSLNKPTLLYWDPESYIHKEETSKYFDHLHAVGILHFSPESAACQVNEIYNKVDDWWNERERKEAVTEFCNQFATSPLNALKRWVNEFRKIK